VTDVGIALSLVVLAVAVSVHRKLGLEKELIIAAARALVQLAAVAAIIHVVLDHMGFSSLLLLVMLSAAAWTSGRRLAGVPRAPWLAGTAIFAASAVTLLILFGLRVFDFEPRFLIPVAGMLIGNSMTATSLAGARVRDEVLDKSLEVEARLALGVPAMTALAPSVRRAASNALIPTIDATKNVGLIFLPGAFVGMILGGEPPAEAAQVQLIVLFMLLGAVAVAGMATTFLVARAFVGPGERIVVPEQLRT
jgi:putative ABC transport system permease protein